MHRSGVPLGFRWSGWSQPKRRPLLRPFGAALGLFRGGYKGEGWWGAWSTRVSWAGCPRERVGSAPSSPGRRPCVVCAVGWVGCGWVGRSSGRVLFGVGGLAVGGGFIGGGQAVGGGFVGICVGGWVWFGYVEVYFCADFFTCCFFLCCVAVMRSRLWFRFALPMAS